MSDRLVTLWIASFVAMLVSLVTFLIVYSMFGQIVLTNIVYFGAVMWLSTLMFLVTTVLMAVTEQ